MYFLRALYPSIVGIFGSGFEWAWGRYKGEKKGIIEK